MTIPVFLFALGLLLLIKGGDWFVDGATGLARRFHIPEILVGATVVSVGTTLPEVMVSVAGALSGNGAMAYGNAIGSIICNTSLIAAITMAVRPGPVDTNAMKIPVLFFFGSAALYCVAAYIFGYFYWWIGAIMLSIFAAYMFLNIRQGLKNPDVPEENEATGIPKKLWQELLILAIGAALIAVGADLLVDNGTIIAEALGVPQTVIALTFVALGTSLPELVTTITSLRKGHGSLGLGNVIGANVFNLVLVSGVAVTVAPFEVPAGNTLFGMNASLILDIPLMVLVMALLCMPALVKGRATRGQGITLLAIYVAFCIIQFAI